MADSDDDVPLGQRAVKMEVDTTSGNGETKPAAAIAEDSDDEPIGKRATKPAVKDESDSDDDVPLGKKIKPTPAKVAAPAPSRAALIAPASHRTRNPCHPEVDRV
jgi:hypothetical protein